MAAPSSARSNTISNAAHTATTLPSHRMDTPTKTLRGLNKPKCIQCGNVARSRCPYQSCKSCCSKAQNPCHIHVLKANATFPDKTPTSNSVFVQQSTEVSPASSSLRVASLRQLSNNFSQFNNLHASRSRKPLTRKEASTINEWRFSRLKEFRERNIEVENEAFDRYMQNISLLEEVFSVKSISDSSTKELKEDCSHTLSSDHSSAEDHKEKVTAGQKLKLTLNPTRNENFRKRMQQIVDRGLKKLQKGEFNDVVNDLHNDTELDKRPEKAKNLWAKRASALSDLTDKLNNARNEEDLTSCLDMKDQIYSHQNQAETKDVEVSHEGTAMNDLSPTKELDYLSQKLPRTVEIGQETLNKISSHFSSLQEVANL